jgi:gamma-glutamyl:cysteine ligase YbdK (ATP-grasp superfamily)
VSAPLPAFAGYGIELEYMIVDRQTLSVLPLADRLLRGASEVERGELGWSNELVLHLIELKNLRPNPSIESLAAAFQGEVRHINRLLEPLGARLMPAAMHPWMDPRTETRLWPHEHAETYRAYDRIFDCKRHGWANLQSMHLNLPFAGDEQFARLHAAARLVLPIIPALAASSPIAEGRSTGFQDFRMEVYRTHQAKISSTIGRVIPEPATSRAEYEAQILAPMYREIAPLDPEGVLQHEWLNVRGAVPRFERNALEIRVIDVQECPQADLAIAAAVVAVVKALYDAQWTPFPAQQEMGTGALADILLACIRDADQAVIADAEYLRLLGFTGDRCQARELWRHLVEMTMRDRPGWQQLLHTILDQGPLARRILWAVGPDCQKARLQAVYRELCDCLEEGRMFLGLD